MSIYNVISADSHVAEPVDLWTRYIDPAFAERAPRVVNRDGVEAFVCDGMDLLPLAAIGAGKPNEDLDRGGTFDETVRPGGYDPAARWADMREDGVDAEVLYPTFALKMYQLPDPVLRRECMRAYNRWLVDFCRDTSRLAGRTVLKGIAMLALEEDGIDQAAAELEEIRRLGLAGAMIAIVSSDWSGSGNPSRGQAIYGDRRFDPFWAKAQDLDLPLSLHILTEVRPRKKIPFMWMTLSPEEIQLTLATLIFLGVFERFPRLKVISAESDAGWLPYFAERMDYQFDRRRSVYLQHWGQQLSPNATPSDFLRRNVWVTFMRDRVGVLARDQIGVDRLMWASDYPHKDSTWPRSRAMIDRLFAGVPDPERAAILHGNVKALYGF
jgi:predicted TIM-barrel fold metal-dependent hydrolase